MLNSAKSFLNVPILSLYNGAKIGSLLDFVVEPNIGKVIGVIGERYGIFRRKAKVISSVDIRELSHKALIVDNEDVLVPQEEIIKIDEILKSGIRIFGSKAITESGKYLGKISDFLIDQFFYLAKLYINPTLINFWQSQLIIPRELILKILKDEIIISDSLLEFSEDTEVIGAT